MVTTEKRTYYLYPDGVVSSKRRTTTNHGVCHASGIREAREIFKKRKEARQAKLADTCGPITPRVKTVEGDFTDFREGIAFPADEPNPLKRVMPGVAEASELGASFDINGVTLFVAQGGHVSVRESGQILIIPGRAFAITDRLLQEEAPRPHDLHPAFVPTHEEDPL